jgi:hypothetical protein
MKYIFLAGKIIKMAGIVVMKLSEKYPYREMYEKSVPEKHPFSYLNPYFLFKSGWKNHFQCPIL